MKLVILDRDGVINFDSDQFIKSPQEWLPIPGSLEAIARLNQAGYRVVVASNQSGVGRGLFDMSTLNAIHAKMHKLAAQAGGRIDAVFFCPHAADSKCACRKPKPGLFQEIAERVRSDLRGVPAIGDSLRDLQAALTVGAQPMLVKTGKGVRTLEGGQMPEGIPVYENLADAVRAILAEAA
ncbi:MAG: D-glycero-beta-D-manno-heptose-1,7-bisphosphate 7-phosphatase [Hydrogenophilales bacterium CG_4_9_14_3_um_filter_63_34]|nr:MAG: D-glycero-beta-D-manno-heptose-1,7-bisphosphate 7-phosphatase [Hydrogenophilales bacterium CG_4_10_14_3_um_filter_63_21]PJB02154.1 MAG: D-glycero-beta-D-manno-heptose-1,7-bisphosphate 7-phosphatase [Hydrogenophilales bacterium CG_4_9_14_3_um_filter_63_34]